MKTDDQKVNRIRRSLEAALRILNGGAGKTAALIQVTSADLPQEHFEMAEELLEDALDICHREIGDADFGVKVDENGEPTS